MLNALTIDVEEYFQVSLFEQAAPPAAWESYPRRAAESVRRLLDLLARKNTHATFFVLGWVARRERGLMREIAAGGHEIASHGYAHRRLHTLSPEDFRADLAAARDAIQDACGVRVEGFRAPSWSIDASTVWALDVLCEEGYRYDSSIFPVRSDRYGWPERPRFPHLLRREAGSIVEVPPAATRALGTNVPVAGGGWLRHLPPALMHWGLHRMNAVEKIPAVVYLHPWEIDPAQPRVPAPALARLRHYRNLGEVFPRLSTLLDTFEFGTISRMLESHPPQEIDLREDPLPFASSPLSS